MSNKIFVSQLNVLTETSSLNFSTGGVIADGATRDLTIAVSGATSNDGVILGLPITPDPNFTFSAFISVADVVTVRATNTSGAANTPTGAANFTVMVLRNV